MSEAIPSSLDYQEQVDRIERTINEARKFSAEQNKLAAEADKFRRERFVAPVLAVVATLGAIAALAPSILRSWGTH